MEMKSCLALMNKKYVAFFPTDGRAEAEDLRKADKRMKYARIIEALQAYPSRIERGVIYDRSTGEEA